MQPPRSSSRPLLLMVLLALLMALAMPFLTERVAERIQYGITRGELRAKAEVARGELAKLSETAETFKLVAQSVGPSVVHIDTQQAVRVTATGDEWDSLLNRRPSAYLAEGQGSGVIVDEDGYIVTNNHVISGAQVIQVNLSDGRIFTDVTVVGADPLTDIAVLKINADKLIVSPWGDSDQLEAGDWVVAVGNPYGLDRSVTAGIVSAKSRRGIGESVYQDFLQTDAAVNPGNSGGPLVNLRGQVIGITTAIFGESFQGISFAVPSNVASAVYQRLRQHRYVARGWLGVGMADVTPAIAQKLGLPNTSGALVTLVQPRTPAARGGIERGDVIVEWNGEAVTNSTDLAFLIARTEIGSQANVVVLRNGQRQTLTITVGERPKDLQ
jgi:serine protease Do